MYTLEKTRTEKLSPRRAQEILARENTFEGQRDLDRNWTIALGEAINKGTLTKGNIAFAQNGQGERFLVNGQHTCQAIVNADQSLMCTIDDYHCETSDDIWRLYATFDVGKQRGEQTIMKAARGLFKSESLRDVPLAIMASCGTSLLLLGDSTSPCFTFKRVPRTVKPELIEKHVHDVLYVRTLLAEIDMKPTIPILIPIIASHRGLPEKADDFWRRVLGGFGLEKNSPEWKLNRELGPQKSTVTKAALGPGGMIRNFTTWNLCVAWWNSFITGKPRVMVRLNEMKEPITMLFE